MKNLKKVLGFQNGYITIFQGDIESTEEWFRKSNARYCVLWGWYVVSEEEVPSDLPDGITAIQLYWDEVAIDEDNLKPNSEISLIVSNKLYPGGISNYVGQVGERLLLTLTVIKNISLGSSYGKPTIMHIFHDEDQNEFIWITGARNWPVETVKTIKGTVKEHKIYKGSKQTILTRCMEVKVKC